LTSAYTQQTSASETPNVPARNPWLTESVFPTSPFDPAQTDGVGKGIDDLQGFNPRAFAEALFGT
jgi:hypothetical protein